MKVGQLLARKMLPKVMVQGKTQTYKRKISQCLTNSLSPTLYKELNIFTPQQVPKFHDPTRTKRVIPKRYNRAQNKIWSVFQLMVWKWQITKAI